MEENLTLPLLLGKHLNILKVHYWKINDKISMGGLFGRGLLERCKRSDIYKGRMKLACGEV